MNETVETICNLEKYRQPHFLIIGACKAGTTTLYDDLARHPDSTMPHTKEPDILHTASDAQEALELWSEHFGKDSDNKIRGEGSTYYTMNPDYSDVSELARSALGPNVKLIYMMRDPITRIESHLAHDSAIGRVASEDFNRIALDETRYVAWSNYAMQLRPWSAAFGRKAILPVLFEEFIADRDRVAQKVAAFVGLDPTRLPACSGISNVRGSQRAPRLALLSRLQKTALYRQHVRPLLPSSVQQTMRWTLTSSRPTEKVSLSNATHTEIRQRLGHLEAELQALNMPKGVWFKDNA